MNEHIYNKNKHKLFDALVKCKDWTALVNYINVLAHNARLVNRLDNEQYIKLKNMMIDAVNHIVDKRW